MLYVYMVYIDRDIYIWSIDRERNWEETRKVRPYQRAYAGLCKWMLQLAIFFGLSLGGRLSFPFFFIFSMSFILVVILILYYHIVPRLLHRDFVCYIHIYLSFKDFNLLIIVTTWAWYFTSSFIIFFPLCINLYKHADKLILFKFVVYTKEIV